MFIFHLPRWLFVLLVLCIAAGCSQKAEEALLETYYRAAAERDAQALKNMTDFSMFNSRSGMSMGLAQHKAQTLYSDIDELYDKHGELEKVVIKKSEEVKEGGLHIWLINAELTFKSGRKIIRKEGLTKHGGEWKVLMFNEFAGQ